MAFTQRNLAIGGAIVTTVLLLLAIIGHHHRSDSHSRQTITHTSRSVRAISAHANSPEALTQMIKKANESLDRMQPNTQLTYATVHHAQRV